MSNAWRHLLELLRRKRANGKDERREPSAEHLVVMGEIELWHEANEKLAQTAPVEGPTNGESAAPGRGME